MPASQRPVIVGSIHPFRAAAARLIRLCRVVRRVFGNLEAFRFYL